MRKTLAYISGQYLLVAAIDEQLPRWMRRSCELTGYAFDWLAMLGTANEGLTQNT